MAARALSDCTNKVGGPRRQHDLAQMQGMDFTTDKLRSLVRKWQTLIEAHVDVKTTDGYLLRLFCISFTMKRPGQVKKTCYAQSSQVLPCSESWNPSCAETP